MRFLVACLCAPIITFALLLFMAGLINQQVNQSQQHQENPYFDLVMVNKDESFASRTRKKPIPPKPQPVKNIESTEIKPSHVSNPNMSATPELPSLDLSSNVSAMAISMPGIESMQLPIAAAVSGEMMAMPLYRIEPRYPRKALRLGKQGYVVLSFDINEAGRVVNIQVLQAKPKRLFEREAKRALKKWKYKPMLMNGKAVSQLGQKIRLDFKMESAI
ncbi:energy transducer TonB [Psychromonas hadalis]|uniref:energy transducer TonB n=1 Tax=Psychromonas hadalis TaxID=211669 RepID=UPI0003B5CBCE|nr:energy transducer TonB [Psychromonas hadalis]